MVVLISDGESTEEEQDAVSRAILRAKRLGIAVQTVGLGTASGDRIPEIDPRTGRMTGYKRDSDGNEVVTRMNERVLRTIAEETGGWYFDANQTGALIGTLKDLARVSGKRGMRTERNDQSAWFVAAALLLLVCEYLLSRRMLRGPA